MEHQATEKQSKRALSYLIGVAVALVGLMVIALFLMFNWAKTGMDVQELREENTIEQQQSPT